jgi:hypothetical protein
LVFAASSGDNVAVASAAANMTFTIDLQRMNQSPGIGQRAKFP